MTQGGFPGKMSWVEHVCTSCVLPLEYQGISSHVSWSTGSERWGGGLGLLIYWVRMLELGDGG